MESAKLTIISGCAILALCSYLGWATAAPPEQEATTLSEQTFKRNMAYIRALKEEMKYETPRSPH